MADVIARYSAFVKGLNGLTSDILYNAMVPAFNKSQDYVPKKTGALMESGALMTFPGADGNAEAEIIYGNQQAWYAALVHEYVWLNHRPPTRAKYLQAAMEEEYESFMESIVTDYMTVLGLG